VEPSGLPEAPQEKVEATAADVGGRGIAAGAILPVQALASALGSGDENRGPSNGDAHGQAHQGPAADISAVGKVPAVEDGPSRGGDAVKAGGNTRQLDDLLAELLRPMVRQWLDENMSRALEKAVRVEVGEGARSAVSKLRGTDKT
jgi:hypothetical protein